MSEIPYNVMTKTMMQDLNFASKIGSFLFLFPFVGRSSKVLACFGFICFLAFLTATQLLITLFQKDFSDWVEILNVVPNLAVVLMAALKYTKIHIHGSVFKKIFEHFRDCLWDVVSDCKEHKKIVTSYMLMSRYVMRFMFYYSLGLAMFVFSFPRIIMYLELVMTGEKSYLYPFDGWYPFDKVDWYYVAYVWEGCMTCVVVCIYGFSGICNSCFTIYICMELKVLGNSIERLITPDDICHLSKLTSGTKLHHGIKLRLRDIIVRHQLLAQMASEFDSVLGDGMLLNYLFGIVFITLTIFTATVVTNFYMKMRYFFMFCSLLMEMFQQCIIGQILSDHSESLAESIYSADWTYADNETKKMLLILMTRTQRPFEYTANGYLAMNLQSFSGICSMSYQFFNLLYTAYDK